MMKQLKQKRNKEMKSMLTFTSSDIRPEYNNSDKIGLDRLKTGNLNTTHVAGVYHPVMTQQTALSIYFKELSARGSVYDSGFIEYAKQNAQIKVCYCPYIEVTAQATAWIHAQSINHGFGDTTRVYNDRKVKKLGVANPAYALRQTLPKMGCTTAKDSLYFWPYAGEYEEVGAKLKTAALKQVIAQTETEIAQRNPALYEIERKKMNPKTEISWLKVFYLPQYVISVRYGDRQYSSKIDAIDGSGYIINGMLSAAAADRLNVYAADAHNILSRAAKQDISAERSAKSGSILRKLGFGFLQFLLPLLCAAQWVCLAYNSFPDYGNGLWQSFVIFIFEILVYIFTFIIFRRQRERIPKITQFIYPNFPDMLTHTIASVTGYIAANMSFNLALPEYRKPKKTYRTRKREIIFFLLFLVIIPLSTWFTTEMLPAWPGF